MIIRPKTAEKEDSILDLGERYPYYLVQVYQLDSSVDAKIITAAEAEKLGYYDDYADWREFEHTFVDGFNTIQEAKQYLFNTVGVWLD